MLPSLTVFILLPLHLLKEFLSLSVTSILSNILSSSSVLSHIVFPNASWASVARAIKATRFFLHNMCEFWALVLQCVL